MALVKATDTITVIEGYDAVRVFLETVWRRHDKPVDEIAFMIGALKWADGSPVDPTRLVGSCSNCSVGWTR
jgi:hypothetical protein